MQALILQGTELPVSLTYQEIPESEGSQYLRPNMENTSLVGGIIREIKGLELLKSWGLGDQAALRAKAEAVGRENVEARSSFHMQKLSTPLYQEKTSHSLMEVSKKIPNISVQHCLQLILCKKTDCPTVVAWPLHGLTEEKEVWSAAVGTVPGPVSEKIAFCTHRFQCLWSGEKGHTWSWAWRLSCAPMLGPGASEGMEVLSGSEHTNLHSFSHGSASLEVDATALLTKGWQSASGTGTKFTPVTFSLMPDLERNGLKMKAPFLSWILILLWNDSLLRACLPGGRDCLIWEQLLQGHSNSAVRLVFPNSPK